MSAVVTSDILGVPRPQGLAFDIGAYEYVTATIGLTTAIYLPLILRGRWSADPHFLPLLLQRLRPSPLRSQRPRPPSTPGADNPNPPASPVKLIFVHHSTGGNWLADPAGNELGGGLGRALMDNNYFVSATNYGWTVDGDAIGDRTDIGNWWEWFRGPNSADYPGRAIRRERPEFRRLWRLAAAGNRPRRREPDRRVQVVLPQLGAARQSGRRSAAYRQQSATRTGCLLGVPHRRQRQGHLYRPAGVFSHAPGQAFRRHRRPTVEDGTWASQRPRLQQLAGQRLAERLPLRNVAVFDFYNVLTSNGGDPNTNDLGWASGNHHRWWNGAVQHQQTVASDTFAYPSGDDHPNRAGNEKATAEFVQLLNVFYNRWVGP